MRSVTRRTPPHLPFKGLPPAATLAGVLLLALLATTTPASSDDLAAAVRAYEIKDYPTALNIWRGYAQKGHAEAQYALGVAYYKGEGVKKNLDQAIAWFRKAADNGHPIAMFNLGAAYWDGRGVRQNYAQAAEWWRRSAEKGEAVAQYNLALCYLSGKGVESDLQKAKRWIESAVKQNHPDAEQVRLIIEKEIGQNPPPETPDVEKTQTQPVQTESGNYIDASYTSASVGASGAAARLGNRNSPAQFKLAATTPVKIVKTSGEWSEVRVSGGIKVWVFGRYVSGQGDSARITGVGVRARSRPSSAADSIVVGRYTKGERVRISGVSGNWKKVSAPKTARVWIRTRQLDIHPGVTQRWLVRWQSAARGEAEAEPQTSGQATSGSGNSSEADAPPLFRAAVVAEPKAKILGRPDPSGAVIAQMDINTPIKIIGSKGRWNMVQVPAGLNVWVWGKFVDENGTQASINRDRVRIRSLPSTTKESDILGILDSGTVASVVSRKGDWIRLRVMNSVSGWMRSDHLRTLSSVSDDWQARWSAARTANGP